jgi:hypothetical protein
MFTKSSWGSNVGEKEDSKMMIKVRRERKTGEKLFGMEG